MSPLMQTIYEYVSRACERTYIDPEEYAHLTACLAGTEARLRSALREKDQRTFQSYLDMSLELISIEKEAMFQAAFAAAKELS